MSSLLQLDVASSVRAVLPAALLLGVVVGGACASTAPRHGTAAPHGDRGSPSSWTLASPDGRLTVTTQLDASGALTYRVARTAGADTAAVLAPSPLGITREDARFTEGLRFVSERRRTVDHAYTLTHGKRGKVRGRAREMTLSFANADDVRVELVFRAYDGGAAFRYRFPKRAKAFANDTTRYTVTGERSGFRLPDGAAGWMLPYDAAGKWAPAYENRYRKVAAGTASPTGRGWGYPALFRVGEGGPWALLTEAGLGGQYAGTHLGWDSTAAAYRTRFPEPDEAEGVGAVQPSVAALPWATPWRVVIVGKGLAGIVESSLSTHLAAPSTLRDTAWVQPGEASWSWWSDGQSPTNPTALRDFVDLAARMGWRYSLVDLNWHRMPTDTLRALADYAGARDVQLALWYNSGGPHNPVQGGPRDRLMDPEERRAEFRRLQRLGIAGIKVDFFNSDKQKIIRHYLDILDDAADFELMVNTHGSTIPRGWHRTYPHLMTMEAVRGAEFYRAEASYAERAPTLNTILPFTRNVIGPMDYTPVTFSDAKHPHQTTDAHELALSVVFESGWQHFADRAGAYRRLPEAPKTFLKQVPAAWDATQFVAGHPGRYVVLARRRGPAWYVGGLNGTDEARSVAVDFSFMEEEERYDLTLIRDGAAGERFAVEERVVRSGASVEVTVRPNGGFVMRMTPAGTLP